MSVPGSESDSKSGMDKINESMAKIGTMLGVQPSNSNLGGVSTKGNATNSVMDKQEPLINKSEDDDIQLQAVDSAAEDRVVGPPVGFVKASGNDTVQSLGTGITTRPTKPGKTKTAVGGLVANIAAQVDNTMNVFNKSVKKVGKQLDIDKTCGDAERGSVNADGTTVTEYVSIDKPSRFNSTPKWVYLCAAIGVAILLSLIISAAVPGTKMNSWFQDVNDDMQAQKDGNLTVAFIGNSYLFVNDVPRVMESISKGRIRQQSVINTAAGLGSILKQGNGMYDLWGESPNALDYWRTFDFKALMESVDVEIDDDYELRDFGYCTVPQLLDGFDNYLSYKNQNGVYFDVGTNPCFEDEYYMMIMQEKSYSDPVYFDYVVLNDQTRRMVDEDGREDSLDALVQAYAALIKTSRAVPILVDTHAFGNNFEEFQNNGYYDEDYSDAEDVQNWEDYTGEDGVEDYAEYYANAAYANSNGSSYVVEGAQYAEEIPMFTAAIYEGVYQYRDALAQNLPENQAPKIAKVGLAYLAIYEDNLNMYAKLFAEDGIHSSQHGTYLFACILYCTMYGHLPMSVHDDFDVRAVFFRSRALFGNNTQPPSHSDAQYLRSWARRIQVEGYVPKSMIFPDEDEQVYEYNVTEDMENEEENYYYQNNNQ